MQLEYTIFITFKDFSCHICRTVVLHNHLKLQYIVYCYIIIEGKNNDVTGICRLCFKIKNFICPNRTGFSLKKIQIIRYVKIMSTKRLSSKDFESYLHTLLSNNEPKVKFQNPTRLRANSFYRLI